MAQSVTRRSALKSLSLGVAGMALARFGLNQAHAIGNGQLDGNAHPNVGGGVWLVSPIPGVPAPLVGGSGTLIHPRVFLTAGHGTLLIESLIAQGAMTLQDLLISFAPDAADPATWRPISGLLTHPDFVNNPSNGNSNDPDVGVLIFDEPVAGITPLPLPALNFLDALNDAGQLKATSDRTRFTVVGYGVDPGGANYGHLPFPPDGLRRSTQVEFQNLHEQWLFTDENDSHDYGTSCTGDSGGPLFWVDPVTGQEHFVAIVSHGTLTTRRNCRVDTALVLDFLNEVIRRVNNQEL